MIAYIKRIFNGRWVQDIINNFDPYEIQMNTNIELNKKYNEKLKLSYEEK